ncbi:riboflavin synthase subunit alpha [Marinobacterium nitratireducens]|uniref:Riboflavin synthase n=1 Tax=Marinobacterium nitratireducens TaxID=518897 RepID=A0A917ZCU5_9GAMM|nr:riboflavin synthase subunit alpha [Marinobacterium nitratireducens]GGO81033.1 riboflavin synthase subunit alpha [Marinobacterium nitratireducens]
MFTGIVQGKARVLDLERHPQFMRLTVELPPARAERLEQGASIALNGTCLTVTGFTGNRVSFDLIVETLRVTNLGDLKVGDEVNFERAARFGDEIGGHSLSGHVHATVEILDIERSEHNCVVWFALPDEQGKYILPKGFVALNGCSLTIGEVRQDRFNVYLIPETLAVTGFGTAAVGERINLEVDSQTQATVDTVERLLQQRGLV